MKVFSPIPSEVAGEVVATPATNGKLVQQGEVLVRIGWPRNRKTGLRVNGSPCRASPHPDRWTDDSCTVRVTKMA